MHARKRGGRRGRQLASRLIDIWPLALSGQKEEIPRRSRRLVVWVGDIRKVLREAHDCDDLRV